MARGERQRLCRSRLGGDSCGRGVATFIVQPNWSDEPRAGLVTIAGHPITVSQRGRPVTEPCVYTLSDSAAAMPHVGGRVAVGLTTEPGCAWDVVLNSSWLHVAEATPPIGVGTVWFDVESNAEGERVATIAIGGQLFTLTQAALPTLVAAGEIRWASVPDPERAGQCWGNCGAGCGTFANPCGGEHRWEHELLTEPTYVGDDWIPMCAGDASWWEVRPRYTALARWTFHGLKSRSCEEHDETCRNLDFVPHLPADKLACTLTAVLVAFNGSYCAGARPFDWSYDIFDVGHTANRSPISMERRHVSEAQRCLARVCVVAAGFALPGQRRRPCRRLRALAQWCARMPDRDVTEGDVDRWWSRDDPATFYRVQRDLYDGRRRALDGLIDERLMTTRQRVAAASASSGCSNSSCLRACVQSPTRRRRSSCAAPSGRPVCRWTR